jgi:hypothetical protein
LGFEGTQIAADERKQALLGPSERWWPVSFGDVGVVEGAFALDAVGALLGSGSSP